MILTQPNPGLQKWLESVCGVQTEVIPNPTEAQVRGKCVLGNLPISLAVMTQNIYTVDMPRLRDDQVDKQLGADEMVAAGARLRAFRVLEVLQ